MMRDRAFAVLLFAIIITVSSQAQTNLIIPTRSLWRYSDLNYRPSETWMQPGFDDSRWTLGASPLGYGKPNVSLIGQVMTAYFRRTFTLTNAPDSWLTLGVRRDDGVIVYLNGVEVFRNNMPTGAVQHFTRALVAVEPTNWIHSIVGAWHFLPGANVVAIEVHQERIDSPDLFFDLELFATNGGPRLTITRPVNNTAVRTGTDLLLEAVAEPLDAIAAVDFYQNNNFIGRADDSPFQVIWTNVASGEHSVVASATTRDGISFPSAPVRVEVAEGFLPSGSITAPAHGATYGTNDMVIEAAASDRDGVVTLVEFFVDGIKIGEDPAPPYSALWIHPLGGQHSIVARITDDTSLSTNTPVIQVQIVDNVLPSGFITHPVDNATIGTGDTFIEVAASDIDGSVTQVEFFVNNVKIGEDSSAPYSVPWTASVGDYSIFARITDDGNLSITTPVIYVRARFAGSVLRGPYLQTGTPTSVIVKWRTFVQSDSVVRYGPTPGTLSQSVIVAAPTTEHEVQVTGLSPDTRYYYSIGSSSTTSLAGPDLFFVTSPAAPKPTRIWVIGDSGTATAGAAAVYNQYLNYTGNRYTDVWLMLGDNAYGSGTDSEYQRAVFEMYPRLLAQTVLWPTIGNHDASPVYFDIFSLPRNGEAGGISSGIENYYSFDYGDIHFVCLGGYYSGSLSSNGPMCLWLKADLEANTKKWLIAYWHQPPYSKGSHDSDWEQDLIAMRENAVPILESYGVDLVLGGHSHSYERSFLMHGHYGNSSTLNRSTMLLDQGSGRMDDTGPYVKRSTGSKAHQGTVYVVNGTGGQTSGGSMDHPVMYVGYLRMGSLILDIDGDTLHGTFLDDSGTVDDYFTISKRSPELRIVSFTHNSTACTISWVSVAGTQYNIEHAPTATGPWTKLLGPITAATSTTSASPPLTSTLITFFRVLQLD